MEKENLKWNETKSATQKRIKSSKSKKEWNFKSLAGWM